MDYFDLGPFSRTITTTSPDAQVWFDRGLNWVYGYNHMEAIACFRKALAHDANCAMAHWGIAYAAGPNYNLPWQLLDPGGRAQALAVAYDATQHALAVADGARAVEQALIRALPARYPAREPVDDMQPWNQDYTHAMRAVYETYPDDLEVRSIFVEAIMNETPWRMWDLHTGGGAAGAGTVEAREVLESALHHLPATWNHPGVVF